MGDPHGNLLDGLAVIRDGLARAGKPDSATLVDDAIAEVTRLRLVLGTTEIVVEDYEAEVERLRAALAGAAGELSWASMILDELGRPNNAERFRAAAAAARAASGEGDRGFEQALGRTAGLSAAVTADLAPYTKYDPVFSTHRVNSQGRARARARAAEEEAVADRPTETTRQPNRRPPVADAYELDEDDAALVARQVADLQDATAAERVSVRLMHSERLAALAGRRAAALRALRDVDRAIAIRRAVLAGIDALPQEDARG